MLTRFLFNNIKIRLSAMIYLVFSFFGAGCRDNPTTDPEIKIVWEAHRARKVIIPQNMMEDINPVNVNQLVEVRLSNASEPILGNYTVAGDAVLFEPLIPFTRGLTYEVLYRGKKLGEVTVEPDEAFDIPEVTAIYPTGDELPVNLLKIHIAFSKEMQEGKVFDNIRLIKNGTDTLNAVFLDMELWNHDRTMLTLWLNPGRIKRDLIPNKEMGPPLEQGARYELHIKKDWRDTEGSAMQRDYTKVFRVTNRDDQCPELLQWTIDAPAAGSRDTLKIKLHEALDYVLLKNAIHVKDGNGNMLEGSLETGEHEILLFFLPIKPWQPGTYTVEAESKLEDLAGNNLERPFDKDLTQQSNSKPKKIHQKVFTLK